MTDIYLLSLGCDKNKVDGEVMLGRLLDAGCVVADNPAEAEVIIINTCGFIREAVQESIDIILEMATYKETGRCKKLIAVGCMTERYREETGGELPEVDAVLGVADRAQIVSLVLGAAAGEENPLRYRLLARKTADTPHIAYIKIAEGCDNNCTYCTIPAIRGRYKSRPMTEILEECGHLIADGARELILVAQGTANYGADLPDEPTLPALLYEINKICEKEAKPIWVRLMYAYPEHVTPELIRALAELPCMCKYLDMPIQHCANGVLKKMGRSGSRKSLIDLITRLRNEVPGIALRTTLMVGFPGETPTQFTVLSNFVKRMKFDRLGVFPYSREEGTPAASMPGQVREYNKTDRRSYIMELQQAIHRESQRAKVGKPLAVMADGPDPNGYNPRRYIGRTQADAPEVDAVVYFYHAEDLKPGDVVTIVPTVSDDYDLYTH